MSEERWRHTCAEDDDECFACGERDCPKGEAWHYHHDGCPVCGALTDGAPGVEGPVDPRPGRAGD